MGTRSIPRPADERRACRRERNTRRGSEWLGRRDRTGRHERRDAIEEQGARNGLPDRKRISVLRAIHINLCIS